LRSASSAKSIIMMAFFLDDADEENDADESNDAEFRFAQQEREDCANTGGRQRGENGNGMNEAFVQDAKNDVDGDEGGENQDGLIAKGAEERGGSSLKRRLNTGRHAEAGFGAVDGVDGVAE